MVKRIFLWLGLIFILGAAHAQDVHFSQAHANPLYLNPGLAGFMETQFRFVANHRSQWNTFTKAYKSVSASIDHQRELPRFFTGQVGIGLRLLSDRAGDGNFGQTSVFIPASIQHAFLNHKLKLSLGIQPGFGQYSVDFNKLYWGSQYNGNNYDPDLPSTETFAGNSSSFFDFSFGGVVRYRIGKGTEITMGCASFHLNRPDISFSEDNSSELPSRQSFFVEGKYPLQNQITLYPKLFLLQQDENKEVVLGSQAQWIPHLSFVQDFRMGLYYRNKDAVIAEMAVGIRDLLIGVSYDFTTSDLNRLNNGLGGFEISLQYLFNLKSTIPYYPPKYCPDFL